MGNNKARLCAFVLWKYCASLPKRKTKSLGCYSSFYAELNIWPYLNLGNMSNPQSFKYFLLLCLTTIWFVVSLLLFIIITSHFAPWSSFLGLNLFRGHQRLLTSAQFRETVRFIFHLSNGKHPTDHRPLFRHLYYPLPAQPYTPHTSTCSKHRKYWSFTHPSENYLGKCSPILVFPKGSRRNWRCVNIAYRHSRARGRDILEG